jgi:hypothetical protein
LGCVGKPMAAAGTLWFGIVIAFSLFYMIQWII